MNTLNISIFGNQIFSEIVNELKLFSKYNLEYYHDLNILINKIDKQEDLCIFFVNEENKKNYQKIKDVHFPLIVIEHNTKVKNMFSGEFIEKMNIPFKALDLEKKIISLVSKYRFKKSSLISLQNYTIDKNERKIKKDGLELQLTEKEIDFLVLFSMNNKPLNRNLVLKKVWGYSSETETHTLETHIHRLRKKIFEKFNDNNFIKNNKNGYFI